MSKVDFWSSITELVTRNPNLGIPALEDGFFTNLLICDYLYYIYILIYIYAFFVLFPGGCRPPDLSLGWTGGRGPHSLIRFFVFRFFEVWLNTF